MTEIVGVELNGMENGMEWGELDRVGLVCVSSNNDRFFMDRPLVFPLYSKGISYLYNIYIYGGKSPNPRYLATLELDFLVERGEGGGWEDGR